MRIVEVINIHNKTVNEVRYPEDPDEYDAMFGGRRKPRRTEPDDIPEPHDPVQDMYRKQDAAQSKYDKEVKIEYVDKEGVAPNGERYNNIFIVRSKTPKQGDSEIYKFKDLNWGAKKIVATTKKTPGEAGDPYVTIVYFVDNHKYGNWSPWKNEPPISK